MLFKIDPILAGICLFAMCIQTQAQKTQFLMDKPGTFICENKLNKCTGMDVTTLTTRLTTISEWVRQSDPIVKNSVGNEVRVTFSGNLCDKSLKYEDYGIHCQIYFAFHHFWLEDGVSYTATGNTAHGTGFQINNPIHLISTPFIESGFQSGDPIQLKQALQSALENLGKYYAVAPVLREIAPGVRHYAGTGSHAEVILVFNPDRPDIWIPVTVKEIMEAKLAYYKVKQEIDSINYEKTLAQWAKLNFKPDRAMRPNQYDLMKNEFGNIAAADLNRAAYSSSQSGISTINVRGEGRPVMKFNPLCWDRTLPVTSVQFISIEYWPATTAELEGFKQRNDGLTDYVGLFYNMLPVEKMGALVQNK
jgi:hypothetical protein